MPTDDLFAQRIAFSPRCWFTWGLTPALLACALTVLVFASLQQVALRDQTRKLIDTIDPMLDGIGAELATQHQAQGAAQARVLSVVSAAPGSASLQAQLKLPDGRILATELPSLPSLAGATQQPLKTLAALSNPVDAPLRADASPPFNRWILPAREGIHHPSALTRTSAGAMLLQASSASRRHDYRAGASMNGTQLWRAFGSWLPGCLALSLSAACIGLASRRRRLGARDTTRMRLAHAIAHDEIEAHLQPLIETDTGRLIGAEMLMRWRHPERGLLMPQSFLPQAGNSGQLTALTEHCFRKLAAQLDATPQLPDAFLLSVNFQLDQLRHEEALTSFAALARPGGRRWYTVLELPSQAVNDPQIRGRLASLQGEGFLIALDDFDALTEANRGIERMPIDMIKLESGITAMLENEDSPPAALGRLLERAREAGLHLVAKGVETERQKTALRRHGLTIAQGFHLGDVLAFEDFVQHWLNGRPSRGAIQAPVGSGPRLRQDPSDVTVAAGS